MSVTEQQLLSFNEFVREKLLDDETDASLDELFDLWRIRNPTDAEYRENVAAVKAALDDVRNGDRGTPLEDHLREMSEKYNISDDA
jgi:hypothetical protein